MNGFDTLVEPRYEATMLNARIRKVFSKTSSNLLNQSGDLTQLYLNRQNR